jgi:dienelactone hydrolase
VKRRTFDSQGKAKRLRITAFLLSFAVIVCLTSYSAGFDDAGGLMTLWVEKEGYVQVASVGQWEEKRSIIQEVLLDFLLPHPDELQPLDLLLLSEEDMGGYVRRKLEYSTLPGERVRAWLLIPTRGNTIPAPGILALHQTTPSGKDEVVGLEGDPKMAYGLELVRRGYVVLAPDGITMGERISGAPFSDTRAIYERFPHWSALGIMTWEAVQAVNVLVSLPEVDSTRIGCIGHSHGGYGSMFLAAFDPRIKAAVSSCGLMKSCDDVDPLRWARSSGFVAMPELKPYVKKRSFPFDFHEVVALIAPTPFLNISASNDPVFPGSGESSTRATDEARVIYSRIYGLDDRLVNLVHSSGHSFPSSARQEAYRWFDRWLKGKHIGREPGESEPPAVETTADPVALTEAPQVRVDSRQDGVNVFSFSLEARSRTSLAIYDVTGRRIRNLLESDLGPGRYDVSWNGSSDDGRIVSAGVYFYRLETEGKARSGKVFVLG